MIQMTILRKTHQISMVEAEYFDLVIKICE